MSVTFNDELELVRFLARAGYTLKELPPTEWHYLIISPRLGNSEPIGCTDNRIETLINEPEMTFIKVSPDKCPFCTLHNMPP